MKIDITSGQLIVASGCYGYSSAISSLIISTAFSHNRYTTPGQRISARSIVVRETHSQKKQTKIDYRPPCFPTRLLFLKLGRGCWPDDPKKQPPPPLCQLNGIISCAREKKRNLTIVRWQIGKLDSATVKFRNGLINSIWNFLFRLIPE